MKLINNWAIEIIGVAALAGAILFGGEVAGANTTGPSAFCHQTDGVFTTCANGNQEWSDITGAPFTDSSGKLLSVLYVDQADKDPTRSIPNGSGLDTLMLMYDEVSRTVPLLTGETVHIHFMTVDNSALLHYDVFVGPGGGDLKVLINGVEQLPMPTGLKGAAGFGASPTSSVPHVIAEFQIGLEAAGFTSQECCYSPDPAWWGSDVPENPQCPDGNGGFQPLPNGQLSGDFKTINQQPRCPNGTQPVLGKPVTTSAAVITANLNGKTTVDPQPLLPPGREPSLCESIGRIVDFRVPPTGQYRNHGDYVKRVAQLTEALVRSQVTAGLITQTEAEKLQSCVVNPRARSNVGK